MKILIVAATEAEIFALKDIDSPNHPLTFLITGPGMIATVYELTKLIQNKKFDLAINCGLAGSFDRSLQIGEVVQVISDTLSELGAEDDNEFLSLTEIGLEGNDTFLPTATIINDAKKVKSITVNTVHGNESSIAKIYSRHQPQIESMEGAAFFYVCEKENIPSLQLRAISNYVEKRNRDAWNIPLALENLKTAIDKLINSL